MVPQEYIICKLSRYQELLLHLWLSLLQSLFLLITARYRQTGKEVYKTGTDKETTETITCAYGDTPMQQSSAYGTVPPGRRGVSLDTEMQDSKAYGVGLMRQSANDVPTYEVGIYVWSHPSELSLS
jgi:hypothetical protein